MGRIVYERYQKGEVQDEDFLELCENIAEREQEIKVCEYEMKDIFED